VAIDQGDAIPVDEEADILQLAMLGVNPITADLLLRSFVDLAPGAWVGQTGANSAVGRYVVALAKRAGVRTLNVVRRPEAAAALLESGADAVVISGRTSMSKFARHSATNDCHCCSTRSPET